MLAGALALLAGCAINAGAGSSVVRVPEMQLRLRVPAELSDLEYVVGKAHEGQPAIFFSSQSLREMGGPNCAAGARTAVSPFPLGQLILSDETPEQIREEAADNPAEDLGEFVSRVRGDHYLYYLAPPSEKCAYRQGVGALQRRQTALLRSALERIEDVS